MAFRHGRDDRGCGRVRNGSSATTERTAQRQQDTTQAIRLSAVFQVAGLSGTIFLRQSDLGPGLGQLHGNSICIQPRQPPRVSARSDPRPGLKNLDRPGRQEGSRILRRKKICGVAPIGLRQGVRYDASADRRWIQLGFLGGSHRRRHFGSEQPAKKCERKGRDPDRPDQSRPQRTVAFATAKERVQSTLILSYRQSETAFRRVSYRIVVNVDPLVSVLDRDVAHERRRWYSRLIQGAGLMDPRQQFDVRSFRHRRMARSISALPIGWICVSGHRPTKIANPMSEIRLPVRPRGERPV